MLDPSPWAGSKSEGSYPDGSKSKGKKALLSSVARYIRDGSRTVPRRSHDRNPLPKFRSLSPTPGGDFRRPEGRKLFPNSHVFDFIKEHAVTLPRRFQPKKVDSLANVILSPLSSTTDLVNPSIDPALPTAPFRAKTMINLEMFPHIIDAIIFFAPRESLQVLRLLSKDFYRKVDLFLPFHVSITHAYPPVSIIIKRVAHSPFYPPPRVRADDVVGAKFIRLQIDGQEVRAVLRKEGDWPLPLRVLNNACVLDVHLPVAYDRYTPTFRTAVAGIHTLRWFDTATTGVTDIRFPCKRVVIKAKPVNVPPHQTARQIKTIAPKIVINVFWQESARLPNHSVPTIAPGILPNEVVYIFRRQYGSPVTSFSIRRDQGGIGLLSGVEWRLSVVKYILVDVHLLDPLCFGVTNPMARSSRPILYNEIRGKIWQSFLNSWTSASHHLPERRNVTDRNVQFLTLDEYRVRVGGLDYSIEVM